MDGPTAVAGNLNGPQVRLVDVSNSANLVLKGITSVQISSCGAVAIHGNQVAVGELLQPHIMLLDISDLNNPRTIGMLFAATIASGFSSLAFLDRNIVVGAGPNDSQIQKVDFSNPASLQGKKQPTGLPGVLTLDADSTSHLIVVGSPNGRQVKLFDQNLIEIGSADSMLPGIASVSLSGRVALVASQFNTQFALIDFGVNPPRVTTSTAFNNLVGVATVAFDGQFGAFGSQSGTPSLSLFDLSGALHGAQPNHL